MYLLKLGEPGVACCWTRLCRACVFCICRATVTRRGVAGSSAPSNFAFTSGIACVWVFVQTGRALEGSVDARHKEAVAAPAMRRHLEIAMVLEPSQIPADNDVSSGLVPDEVTFLKRAGGCGGLPRANAFSTRDSGEMP